MRQNRKDIEHISNSYISIIKKYKKAKINNIYLYFIYPQLNKMQNKEVQFKINNLILDKIYKLICSVELSELVNSPSIYIVNYEITYFINYVLSIKFYEYFYIPETRYSTLLLTSITINIKNGIVYGLKDLFDSESNYKDFLNQLINNESIKFNIDVFNHNYYLTQDEIIIYNNYELISIPFCSISHIISKNF